MKKPATATSKPKELVKSSNLFPVVGIGASAGGLDAFKKLLKAIPVNSGMAFVLVQHLDPNHESLLPEILQKVTPIPVSEISDDIKVQPDHIYVIPSNKMMVATDGVLQLTPRPAKGKNERHLPIDLFFESLAEVHQSHAIGVVLSGTASDGTLGLKAIKDHGGITFAQDTASAEYDGMPYSAAQAGVVDFILPPEEIPIKLLEVTKIIGKRTVDEQHLPLEEEEVFKQIISLLRIRKGTDFTYYKQTTIRRRILRRMALNKNEEPAGYLKYLRENKAEQDVLYQDMLIPVTSFFRDPKTFENVCDKILPIILKNKYPGDPIRVWVAGCSTGEEAYSIAICIKEFLANRQERVQVFATDISEPAIAKARTGIYSKVELSGVSPHRLKEYFTKNNGSFQVNKAVREMCVFADHNFLKDPPFGKIDLISCRNVLIYMEPYLQKKALTTFHYSLNAKGFLLLGKSETIGGVPNLFASETKNDKVFSRKDGPGRLVPVTSERREEKMTRTEKNSANIIVRTDFQKTADDIMLRKFTPASVVVNDAMDIVHFRGNTGNYLEQSAGKPTHNVLAMAKHGLAFELRNILHKAKKDKVSVLKENIPVQINDQLSNISIEAIPLPDTVDPYFLILFHDSAEPKTVSSSKKKGTAAKLKKNEYDLRIHQLEHELSQTREDMRSITEDQEAANEELQSANEELLSSSEELQSLNEELETSKEELQSTNEELMVVNQEMMSLNKQITESRDYCEAIITTMHGPLLVLDKFLRVKTANRSFYNTFEVDEPETEGVLIYELGNRQWDIPRLRTLLEKILPEKSIIKDFEITHHFSSIGERTMRLNAHELIEEGTSQKLILISIEDITKAKSRSIELETAVAKRTSELQAINKELQAFAYVSSHDLQEPLRKIITFSGRILKEENKNLSAKGKDHFRRVQDAAERMQKLIEDLLSFSRVNTSDRVFEDIDLRGIIKEVKTELKETIKQKHATIEATKLCPVRVIPFQFRQLMQNLIGNALKFSRTGVAPHIVISSRVIKGTSVHSVGLLPEKQYCHISVKDNGIGFEPEYKDRIFEVFQKLHGKEVYAGTGIGLAIVKKIVENHGGIVTATGVLNKGAKIDIYLPIK